MSYTLLTSEEIIEFLNSDRVMNGDNQYPLGIQYKVNYPGAPEASVFVYDATAHYYLGSDNKYVRYAGRNDIKVATKDAINSKIMAASTGRAHSITALSLYKDNTPVEANPDGSVVEDEYYVGNDTLVLGKGTVGSADYSIIQGVDLYGLKTSAYLMAVGYGTNITNSANIVGALSKAVVNNVHGAMLISGDSVIDNDSGHGFAIKNSSGVAVLARDYNVNALSSVVGVHASVVLGNGGGDISNTEVSIVSTHNIVDGLYSSLFLSSGFGNVSTSTGIVAAGNGYFNLKNASSSLFLGSGRNSNSTGSISYALVSSGEFKVSPSDAEIKYGVETTSGSVSHIIAVGKTSYVDGYTNNVVSVGETHYIEQWSPYMQLVGEPSRIPEKSGDGIAIGDIISVGYNSNRFALLGSDACIGMGSTNIISVGKEFNGHAYYGITRTYACDYKNVTADELRNIISTHSYEKEKVSQGYCVLGTGDITMGDVTIPLNANGITSYIYISYNSTSQQYSLTSASTCGGVIDDTIVHVVVKDFTDMLRYPSSDMVGKKYVLHGDNETHKIECGGTTIDLDASGITSYVVVIETYTPSTEYPNDKNKGTYSYTIQLCAFDFTKARYNDLYAPMPSNDHNIVSIGDTNVIRSGWSNTILIGDKLSLGATKLTNSIIIENNLELGNFYKTVVSDDGKGEYTEHNIKGVFWYDTDTGSGTSLGDRQYGLSVLDSGSRYHTHNYSDAFAFVNSNFHNSLFFGIFWDPTDTMSGFSTDDAVRGLANKPDAPMIYTGGIALGGRGDGSGYGLMKVGNLYTSIASYIKTNWTSNDFNIDNDVVLTPGTAECPYAGMPLAVKSVQEYDGTFRIGAGKIDARGVNIKSIGDALSSAGFGGGFLSNYGISAYINTSTSTDASIGYDYDTATLIPQNGAIYTVHFPSSTWPLNLADPTDDDVGKQFIIHAIYCTNNGVNGQNSFIKYKCVKFGIGSTQATGGGDNKYAYLVPPLPGILDEKTKLDGCSAAITTIDLDRDTTIGFKDADTSNVKGSGTNLNIGTVGSGCDVGYSVIMTVVKVPKYSTSSPYKHTTDEGYEICYMPTPLSPIYYCN